MASLLVSMYCLSPSPLCLHVALEYRTVTATMQLNQKALLYHIIVFIFSIIEAVYRSNIPEMNSSFVTNPVLFSTVNVFICFVARQVY